MGLSHRARKLAIAVLKTSKSTSSEALCGTLVAVESSTEEVGQTQVKSWLQHCKKTSNENLIESVLGGTHQWKEKRTPASAVD